MIVWQQHEILKPPTDEELAAMEPEDLVSLHALYHEAIANSVNDPYRYGFQLENWKRMDEEFAEVTEALALGGNRCLAPDQLIFDPVANESRPVSEIDGPFHVWAWDGSKKVVALAEKPFRKPQSEIFRVSLDNGEVLNCSAAHLLLTPGGWKPLGNLSPGDSLVNSERRLQPCPPPSISESAQPKSLSDARRWIGKALGWTGDCFERFRRCGEQLRLEAGTAQVFAPSLGDAPTRKRFSGSIRHWLFPCAFGSWEPAMDGPGNTPECIRSSPQSDRRATRDDLERIAGQCADIESRVSCKPCKSAWPKYAGQFFGGFQQSKLGSFLLQSIGGFARLGRQLRCVLASRKSQLLPPIVKIQKIDYLRIDWVWDFTVPVYHNYIAAGVISHNSGKTRYGARSIVKAAVENPNSEIFCFAQTSEVSIRQQQAAVWEWLPVELKTKQVSTTSYISYSKKNGFTDGSLILPNGSQIIFKTYSQWQNNPTILEGAELGSRNPKWLNIGVWLDEYLLGPELINTLRFRLATRNSKMLVTFTPIDGWTEVIKEYLDGARTLESRPAELLNGELVPYVQRSKKLNACVVYFHSKDNPFGGYERIKQDLAGRSREDILIRAYGVPVKSQATKFPKFSTTTNVLPHHKIPTEGVTRYQIIDPSGAKNWFAVWIAVDAMGTFYVYREWPGINVGEWAEWRNGKWMPGEGAKGLGYGIIDYVDMFREMEGKEEIAERIIDPRLGAAKYVSNEGASSIIEDLADHDFICIPAPGLEIDDGLQSLISKMSYDTTKPIDSLNRPKFYVSEECENVIKALAEYTAEAGLKEAWKDPVDCLRYACVADIQHFDENAFAVAGRQGRGGY